MNWRILEGDCRAVLRGLEPGSVQACVTSPPYWGLRDYGLEPSIWGGEASCDHDWGEQIERRETNHIDSARWQHTRNGRDEEQPEEKRAWRRATVPQGRFCLLCFAWEGCLGLEPSPDLYVEHLVEVFAEVWRVLRPDGTLWLNLGDCFATGAGRIGPKSRFSGKLRPQTQSEHQTARRPQQQPNRMPIEGLKAKDLVGVPWRTAFALQAAGWWLRSEIIWAKPNPMPESVQDRPTSSHEQIFLLAKSRFYHYDRVAILERDSGVASGNGFDRGEHRLSRNGEGQAERWEPGAGRNRRDVWEVMVRPFPEAHFATFPPELVRPCVLAGTPPKSCGICGAPRRRIEKREQGFEGNSARAGRDRAEIEQGGKGRYPGNHSNLKSGPVVKIETLGWESGCEHDDDSASPLVLDPFSGAGTTLLVAEQHGRRSLGIEANPEYAEMARERLRRWEANPAGALEGDPEPRPGQLELSDD